MASAPTALLNEIVPPEETVGTSFPASASDLEDKVWQRWGVESELDETLNA
jgi:hypothetical protein